MDIIQILQLIQPYIPTLLALFTIGTIALFWKGFRLYQRKQSQKYSIAHIRKMAGIATDGDKKTLKNKPPLFFGMNKRKKKFVWKDFIKSLDIREDVKKLNPFAMNRQITQLQKDLLSISNAHRSLKWSLSDLMKVEIAKDKEPKKPKSKLEDMPKTFLTRKDLSDRQISLLIPRPKSSLFE